MTDMDAEVCVVGGGVSGLTAAYRLGRAGRSCIVLDAADRFGGRVKTVQLAGCAFDVGAIGMLGSYAETVALARELGLGSRLSRQAVCLAIPRQGRLYVLDMSNPLSILRSKLLSGASLWRLRKLAGPMLKNWSKLNFESISDLVPQDIESVGDYASRELTPELYEYLVGPIIRALWQRDPETAPLIDLYWSLKAFSPSMYALEGGMQLLSDTLASRIVGRTGVTVCRVEDTLDGAVVTYVENGQERIGRYRACVLAVPPLIAAQLLTPLPATLGAAFQALPYSCSVNLHLVLNKPVGGKVQIIFPPHCEAPDLTTVVFEHNKGPGRAVAGKGAMSLFWRDAWSRKHMGMDDAAVLMDAFQQISRVVPGFDESLIEATHIERWQFSGVSRAVGGSVAVAAVSHAQAQLRHVVLAGDYFALSGINAAVVAGLQAARRLNA